MLIEFRVSNFRSIRQEQTFSLVAGNLDKKLSSCVIDRELPGLSGVRYLKGAAIYGANASGKSNLLAAVLFVGNFVERSATRLQPGDPTGAEPFRLDLESPAKPCQFEITFVVDNDRYVFGFSVTTQRVTEEYLVAYPKGVPQRWYHRSFNPQTDAYEWAKPSTAFKSDKSLQGKTRANSLFLSVGPQFNHAQLTRVYHWFKSHLRFIHLNSEAELYPDHTADLVARASHHERILNLLKSADIGVTDAQIQEKEITPDEVRQHLPPSVVARIEKEQGGIRPGKRLEIRLMHRGDKIDPIAMEFDDEESAGTRRFFALIGPWTEILDNGYTVFVDEIETSLHPLLVKELLKLVFSDTSNPKGAQVIFTTHNPILLDRTLMRRDQVWFAERSQMGASHFYALTDYKAREGEAREKGYLAGRYGGIPFIPEGLKL